MSHLNNAQRHWVMGQSLPHTAGQVLNFPAACTPILKLLS
jgi:hypothetical protein